MIFSTKYINFITAIVLKNFILFSVIYPSPVNGQVFKGCDNPTTVSDAICVAQTESCAPSGCFSSITQCSGGTAYYFQYNDFASWGLCNPNPPSNYGGIPLETSCSKCQYYYCARGTAYLFNINGSCYGSFIGCNYVAFKRDACIQ